MLTGALREMVKETKKKKVLSWKYHFLDFWGVECTSLNARLLYLLH